MKRRVNKRMDTDVQTRNSRAGRLASLLAANLATLNGRPIIFSGFRMDHL